MEHLVRYWILLEMKKASKTASKMVKKLEIWKGAELVILWFQGNFRFELDSRWFLPHYYVLLELKLVYERKFC